MEDKKLRRSQRTECDDALNQNHKESINPRRQTRVERHKAEAACETQLSAPEKRRHSNIKGHTTHEEKNRSFGSRLFMLFTKANNDYVAGAGDYVTSGGKSIRNNPRKFSMLKTLRNFVVMLLFCALILATYITAIVATAPKIDPHKIYNEISQSSVIYDENGRKLDLLHFDENRTLIKYNQLPKHTVDAFIALEDKTFRKHHGFNWIRMLGAFKGALGSGSISGTSTITQQLARNVYLPKIKSQRSIKRKILEMYYASKIERALSKDKIFEAYVNSIYFGFGNYGIEQAAKNYFSCSVNELTLEQSAALAALPQSPDSYALIQNADNSNSKAESTSIIQINSKNYICNDISAGRRDLCLQLMLKQGKISNAEFNKAYGKNLKDFIKPSIDVGEADDTSYFTDYMVNEIISDLMKKYKISYSHARNMIYRGGLKIYSTVDKKAQDAIELEFNKPDNFPAVIGYKEDENHNIVGDSGKVLLFAHNNLIDANGNFTLTGEEYKKNDNGSLTIYAGKRLNIYKTSIKAGTDYSLEFMPSYVKDDSGFYIYAGGYITIPAKYKSLDKKGNLIIAADFLKNNRNLIDISGDNPVIHKEAYTLPEKVIQPQGAMVITEVGTGEIKAMVGGRGVHAESTFNRATSPRQPGSSIKPLAVYAPAIQQSYELYRDGKKFKATDFGYDKQGSKYYGDYLTSGSTIIDEPMNMGGKIWPKNADNRFRGKITMKSAMQQSVNVAAVKLYQQIGGEYSLSMVKKFGLKHVVGSGRNSDMNPAGLALGGMVKGATPLEMSEAYATFPNRGKRKSSISYTKVEDSNGTVILSAKSKSTKVLNAGVAYIMTDMLQAVVSSGTGTGARISGERVGGKTGTTSNTYDIWFNGFTSKYSAALWIGNDYNIALSSSSRTAALLWGRIISQIPAALGGKYHKMPKNVIRKGNIYFIKGTEKGVYSIYDSASGNSPNQKSSGNEQNTDQTADKAGSNKPEDSQQKQKPDQPANPDKPINPDPNKPPSPSNPDKNNQ